ncbi:hypothetical protein PORY_000109 [Pneumocystis oryctolagi]|uniref:Uncharacterized protein n=1 Tax=Pneumocystis oryctolagi TaxID=42067 RepID=A0ACB7CEA1_9ASCO|nr:hypothetical protein PORY_000109 [Pneumocystis oryctolagi]
MIRNLVIKPRISLLMTSPGFSGFFFREKSTKKSKKKTISIPPPNMLPLPLALRYLRAAEVGRSAKSSTIELHLRMQRKKGSVPLKGTLKLPRPAKPYLRVCVIAEGEEAQIAKKEGAAIVGSNDVIEKILQGQIEFDVCIAHKDTFHLLEKVSKVPGSKRWMPSIKNGTVCSEVGKVVNMTINGIHFKEKDVCSEVGKVVNMTINGIHFKEKDGLIQIPLGNAHYSDSEIRSNLRSFLEHIGVFDRKKAAKVNKNVSEIVLSSSHGMGIILDPLSI